MLMPDEIIVSINSMEPYDNSDFTQPKAAATTPLMFAPFTAVARLIMDGTSLHWYGNKIDQAPAGAT